MMQMLGNGGQSWRIPMSCVTTHSTLNTVFTLFEQFILIPKKLVKTNEYDLKSF